MSSRVAYDSRSHLVASVKAKLFDHLFYVGLPCRGDAERNGFFTSVASSIDPYLDSSSGPPLLEASLNDFAAASSFGGARFYVPVETLGALFAWEEVAAYLRAACAPREGAVAGEVRDLAFGAASERQTEARAKVENLLQLFKEVLNLRGTPDELRAFARRLDAKTIVKEWYGASSGATSGLELSPAEELHVKLTYAAAAYSLSEDDAARVTPADRRAKTYAEHKTAKLPQEGKTESRDRFAAELERVMQRYKETDASNESFEKGRRLLFDKLSRLLRAKVDAAVTGKLAQENRFGVVEGAEDQGTVLTRLYQELGEMLADRGALQLIDEKVATFISALSGEEEQLQHEANRAIKDLRDWMPSGLLGMGSPEESQQAARENVSRYLEAYQRSRLLTDMQKLVREVKARVEEWAAHLRSALRTLVLDPAGSCHAEVRAQLVRHGGRLWRMGQNPAARISCQDKLNPETPDVAMSGYREELRQMATAAEDGRPLHAALLEGSKWELAVDEKGHPRLRLWLPVDGQPREFGEHELRELHRLLYERLRKNVDARLEQRDVFDYLAYLERDQRIGPQQVAEMLHRAAKLLINARTDREFWHFVVQDPVDQNKRRWVDSVDLALRSFAGGSAVSRTLHSDRQSITLFKVVKPNLDAISNVDECRRDYVVSQQDVFSGDERHDKELLRAQVYHPFAPELEAWYVERRAFQRRQERFDHFGHIPARIVRLLEEPEMMRMFVLCVASGAIENVGYEWIWHGPAGDVPLSDKEQEPDANLVRAAVVFVLQKREGTRRGLRRIDGKTAEQSAVAAAHKQGKRLEEAVKDFLESELETYLERNFPSHDKPEQHRAELAGLRMIFEFYGQPTTRALLRQRQDLVFTS
ncbi:MAG: hypothetical protein HC897_16240 [Thermoanaerobaculia bacterium]|nr:hypothetical protein [Thermoanaerobaculia bacterium]